MLRVGLRVASKAQCLHGVSRHAVRSCSSQQGVLGIRREDSNVWERRAPLAPHHVNTLVNQGVKVLVQPSNRRAYSMKEYTNAGAEIAEDMKAASVIMGVKPVPIDLLEADKTYVFFSHTIKAQPDNMAMLDAILQRRIRLIDYEPMVDEKGVRTVAFGKYAGMAGMINILHGMGLRLLALGHHTPFMHIGPAHNYRHTMRAIEVVKEAGYEIALDSMPKSIGPLTFVFTGSGNVSKGAREIFEGLPVEYVEPEQLAHVAEHGETNRVYGCVVSRKDHIVRKDDGTYNAEEYEQFPDRYTSVFNTKYAPYASCIVNGMYWTEDYPRLITIEEAKPLIQPPPGHVETPGTPALPHRLLAIADISNDCGGAMEFMTESTTIDRPFSLYSANGNLTYDSYSADGVMICSIENMPAQIPRESTDFFGGMLLPYCIDILKSDATTPFEEFDADRAVKDAVITSNGELTDNFKYIQELRQSTSSGQGTASAANTSQRVLILGSGFVSAPVIDYLTRDDKVAVTVASPIQGQIDRLSGQYPNTTPVLLDLLQNQEHVEKLVKEHDIVISLLPFALHPEVAKICIKHKTNLVTASYRTPEMAALHEAAEEAGILVMNEVGLDPGIDHMLALQCFHQVQEQGATIKSFVSWVGGLPAPENSNNPLRYKFNWSPLGVLKNVLAGARYLHDGKVVDIPEGQLLKHTRDMEFLPEFDLEGFPNRDSLKYANTYGIQSAQTLLRGTLRFKGFSQATEALRDVGLFGMTPLSILHQNGPDITWRALMCELMGQRQDMDIDTLKSSIYDALGKDEQRLSCIVELGLLEDDLVDKQNTAISTLSTYLTKRLSYGPRERDLAVMHHEVGIQWPDSRCDETRHIDLVQYGDPDRYSAMSANVGFTTGIATKMVLQGEIQGTGMMVPFDKQVYRPILQHLKDMGISAREHTVTQ